MTSAFIGLGSNQSDPQAQLKQALNALKTLPKTQLLRCSPKYWTPPWGDVDQPDFLNAVAELTTELRPQTFLQAVQQIENDQGRRRDSRRRWGPRPLDLDLLLYGDQIIDLPELQVPHPRMTERAFVLQPLVDLEPEIAIPGQGPASDFLSQLDLGKLRCASKPVSSLS
ncbi:MAG: 2-amino-4-hydroxy-6-hydroxymethyldihydropteridine diphosphokinase [Pseudomonadota bacterium]